MAAEREALAERIRAALPQDRPVREVSMFGGLSFMVDDAMAVVAGRDGELLVPVDPARNGELLGVLGAKPAVMGADRPMGPGWLAVSPDGVADDGQLAFWLRVGLEAAAAKRRHTSGP